LCLDGSPDLSYVPPRGTGKWQRHRVCELGRLSALYPIDSEHTCYLSAIDENPSAGSTCVRGTATGDSLSAYCAKFRTF